MTRVSAPRHATAHGPPPPHRSSSLLLSSRQDHSTFDVRKIRPFLPPHIALRHGRKKTVLSPFPDRPSHSLPKEIITGDCCVRKEREGMVNVGLRLPIFGRSVDIDQIRLDPVIVEQLHP